MQDIDSFLSYFHEFKIVGSNNTVFFFQVDAIFSLTCASQSCLLSVNMPLSTTISFFKKSSSVSSSLEFRRANSKGFSLIPFLCTARFGLPFVPPRGIWERSLSLEPSLLKVPPCRLRSIMFLARLTLSATLWSIDWLSVEPSDNTDVDGESTVSDIPEARLKRPAASAISSFIASLHCKYSL